MAKRLTSTRRSTTKDSKAKETVSNLLKDVMPKKEEKTDKLESSVEKKGIGWLETEIDRLTKENERLQEDYNKLLQQFNEQKNSSGSDVATREGIINIFKNIENAYLGRNPERVRYDKAFNKVLLDKFLATFPFISQK